MGQVEELLKKKLRGQPGSESPVELPDTEMSQIRKEIVKNNMVKQILHEDDKSGGKEDSTLATALAKANTELTTTFIKTAQEALQGKGKGEESIFMTYLLKKMEKMEEEAQSSDPLAIYKGVQAIINELQSHVTGNKEEKQVVNTGADIRLTIELESMKMEREERQRQWEAEKEERAAARADANFRWQEEFKLRLEEFHADRERKANSGGAFEDLFGALSDSLQHRAPGAQREIAAPAAAKPRAPMKFKCARTDCGATITVPTPNAPVVECPNCHTIYDLVPASEVAAVSAAPPAAGPAPPAVKPPPVPAANAAAPAAAPAASLAGRAAQLSDEEREAEGE